MTILTTASAKPTTYNFAGISWGSTKANVKSQMESKGYTYTRSDSEGDLWFKGTISQEKAQIVASFTPSNKFVRSQIILEPKQNFYMQRYKIIKESLINKYGVADSNKASFTLPYKAGDGYETQAIRQGKATFRSIWLTEWLVLAKEKIRYQGLLLEISKELLIYITYNDWAWNGEYKRRYDKGNHDL